jgi:hypothetical protein
MRGSIKFIEENSDWIYVKEVYAFSTRMQLLDSLDCCRITHSCTHTSDVCIPHMS